MCRWPSRRVGIVGGFGLGPLDRRLGCGRRVRRGLHGGRRRRSRGRRGCRAARLGRHRGRFVDGGDRRRNDGRADLTVCRRLEAHSRRHVGRLLLLRRLLLLLRRRVGGRLGRRRRASPRSALARGVGCKRGVDVVIGICERRTERPHERRGAHARDECARRPAGRAEEPERRRAVGGISSDLVAQVDEARAERRAELGLGGFLGSILRSVHGEVDVKVLRLVGGHRREETTAPAQERFME